MLSRVVYELYQATGQGKLKSIRIPMKVITTRRLLLLLLFINLISYGQEKGVKYYPATEFGIQGLAKEVSSDNYNRIDSLNSVHISKRLQKLSRNAAGLYVEFQTNSSFIDLKWELESYTILRNMTPLAVNGFDLYGLKGSTWQYVDSGIAKGEQNEVRIIKNMETSMTSFRLYFPLYSTVKSLAIGVDPKAAMVMTPYKDKPRIVIYGSSITQGASASRPGMAFTSIMARALDVEVINLGFSGSGKMEAEMAAIIKKIKADVFILDCVPNPSPEQITERTIPFVKQLREAQPNVPIVMVESLFREAGNWNQVLGKNVKAQNEAFYASYRQLLKNGYTQLHYIYSQELIGDDHEATTDGVHFSDLGHYRMAITLEKKLSTLLNYN